MPDIKEAAELVLPILQDGAKSLWDGAEDTEFLKEMALEIGKLRALKLTGVGDLDAEIAILEETVRQRATQKRIRLNGVGESMLPKIIGIALKVAIAFI